MPNGILYLVSTPIGNLADISFRAVEVLKSVDLIACEDTRHSRILLDHYEIKKPMVSYFEFSEKKRAPELIQKLEEGAAIALISDAGTPGISDPGYRLVRQTITQGIKVESIPGASAFLCALSVSGLPTDRFVFEGFMPIKSGQRKNKLLSLKGEKRTVIFYESPHRLLKTLEAIESALGDVEIVVARELTKKFEEVVRGRARKIIEHFSAKKVLGEFVILFSAKNRGGSTK